MFGQLALKPADLVAKGDQLIEDVGRLPWTATLNEIDREQAVDRQQRSKQQALLHRPRREPRQGPRCPRRLGHRIPPPPQYSASEQCKGANNPVLTACLTLNFVILLPALAWRSSDQQLVGNFVVSDGFGLTVKLEGIFRALGDASEAEDLAEFTANREV